MKNRGLLCLAFFLLLSAKLSAQNSAIDNVSTSTNFFNPSAGEKVLLKFRIKDAGSLTVQVLDRDGYCVRTLASKRASTPQEYKFEWDGKDEVGLLVADEAYSFKIDLLSKGRTESYFPCSSPTGNLPVAIDYYDRRNAIVSYQLLKPARVHLQGVIATLNPKTGEVEGPVLKTIVNRAPRAAGKVVEFWNGFNDDDQSIYLPDHPHFKMAVSASELPAGSVISFGNESTSFLQSALTRKGESFASFAVADHQHHQGLSTLEDVSPDLKVQIANGKRVQGKRVWIVESSELEISGTLEGPGSSVFAKQPGRLWIFIDERRMLDLPPPSPKFRVHLPLEKRFSGEHILAVNWVSEFGPVAVNALRFELHKRMATQSEIQTKARKRP